MVGRDRVAQHRERAHAGDVGQIVRLGGHAREKRGLAHIRRIGMPVHRLARGGREGAPMFVAIPDCAVLLGVEILGQGRGNDFLDLLH